MISEAERNRVRGELELKERNLQEVLSRYAVIPTGAPKNNEERADFVTTQLREESNHKASRQMLKDVTVALRKLNDGTWGVCPVCGKEISEDRRNAISWASRCKPCQEKKGLSVL